MCLWWVARMHAGGCCCPRPATLHVHSPNECIACTTHAAPPAISSPCKPHSMPPLPLPPPLPAAAEKQMSYDAGDRSTTGFDPLEAIQAYCAYFPCNRVLAGVQVPPEVRAGRGERGWAAGSGALLCGLAQHIGLSACQSARLRFRANCWPLMRDAERWRLCAAAAACPVCRPGEVPSPASTRQRLLDGRWCRWEREGSCCGRHSSPARRLPSSWRRRRAAAWGWAAAPRR